MDVGDFLRRISLSIEDRINFNFKRLTLCCSWACEAAKLHGNFSRWTKAIETVLELSLRGRKVQGEFLEMNKLCHFPITDGNISVFVKNMLMKVISGRILVRLRYVYIKRDWDFPCDQSITLHQYLTGHIIFMLQYRGIPLFFVFVLFWYPMHCLHQRLALSTSSSNFVFRQTDRQTDRRS